jgi:hypothetical protein
VQTVRAYGGVEVQLHLGISLTAAPDGLSGQPHAPSALPNGKWHPVPFELKAGWTPSQSGRFGKENISLPAWKWATILSHLIPTPTAFPGPFRTLTLILKSNAAILLKKKRKYSLQMQLSSVTVTCHHCMGMLYEIWEKVVTRVCAFE